MAASVVSLDRARDDRRRSRHPRRHAADHRGDVSRLRRSRRREAGRSKASPGSAERPNRRHRSSTASFGSSVASSCSSCSGFASGRPVRRTCPRAVTSSSEPPIAAGWTRSLRSTRSRPRRGRGSSAARHRRSRRRGASGSSTGSVACCLSGAAGSGIDTHVASARAVIGNGGVFVQMPEGTVSGPPGRIGPFRVGWAVIALRVDPPIVPLAIAGTEELYLGRRFASQILPATTVRELAGLESGAPLPAPGTREELEVAHRITDALALRLGPAVEALYPQTVDPPGHPRRLRKRLTWLLLKPGRPRPHRLTRAGSPYTRPRCATPRRSSTSWDGHRSSGSTSSRRTSGRRTVSRCCWRSSRC